MMATTAVEEAPPPPLPDHHLPARYTPDGSFNHPSHPLRGAAGSPRIRAHPPLHSYRQEDGAPNNASTTPLWHHPRLDLPSARRILVELFQRTTPRHHSKSSQLSTAFGLFVTRDVSRTEFAGGEDAGMRIECDGIETRGPFCPGGRRYVEFHRAVRTTSEGWGGGGTGGRGNPPTSPQRGSTWTTSTGTTRPAPPIT